MVTALRTDSSPPSIWSGVSPTRSLSGQDGEAGLGLEVVSGTGDLATANPSDDRESEGARQHGRTTEKEGGRVTSCDVDQPSCRKRKK